MYCPKCAVEYQDGYYWCSDCLVPLVHELPYEPVYDYVKAVTAFETTDRVIFAIAKGLLEAEGIPYTSIGEEFFNLLSVTPVQIRVEPERVKDVQALLADLLKPSKPIDLG
jgi:hypothetical protein